MGFSISWLATPSDKKEIVLSALGLAETNQRQSFTETARAGIALPTGWYVVWFDTPSPSALKPEFLRMLSASTKIVACQIEEHAMVSTAACWENGKEQWFIAHDAEDGVMSLDVMGNPPVFFDEVRAEMLQLQDGRTDVDYVFDVAIMLAERLVGFRHDAAFDENEEEMFFVLSQRSAA
ncbi:hypothetical protein [Herbaspirillum sp. 1130]|uniref:hypothetical protein n=1 Tax=Herbaspirillum sp. 1130 TaxID=2806562 RepID=UPI001AE0EFD9|nr:hypothetical protein [Herbaspirillum sp. 1130]MBP1317525.1 hypothetical protein [Herbaspirillum sp. 1130]